MNQDQNPDAPPAPRSGGAARQSGVPGLPARSAPSPAGRFPLGQLGAFSADQLKYYSQVRAETGDFVRLEPVRGLAWYFVAHPDTVEQMLLGNYKVYSKGMLWNRVRRVLGNGLLTNDGELWRDHRRALQPAFHQGFQRDFANTMCGAIEEMLVRWEELARRGEPVDALDEMSRITLQNAGLILFGMDFTELYHEMGPELNFVVQRMNSHNFWKPWTLDPRLRRALKKLHRMIQALVARRRTLIASDNTVPDDMLTALLRGSDASTGTPFSDAEIHNEILTFIFVGHETTALSLAWAFSLLANNPACEARALQEVDDVLTGRRPAYDDLENLPYIKNVFLETLRLYPPVWGIARETTVPVTLGGYDLPAKSILMTIPYITQRHPEFWPDPERFEPDRFTAENAAGRHRFAYYPFGGGPRLCIGLHFALLEAQLVIAAILQRFRMPLVPGQNLDIALWATLRPRHGVKVLIEKRN